MPVGHYQWHHFRRPSRCTGSGRPCGHARPGPGAWPGGVQFTSRAVSKLAASLSLLFRVAAGARLCSAAALPVRPGFLWVASGEEIGEGGGACFCECSHHDYCGVMPGMCKLSTCDRRQSCEGDSRPLELCQWPGLGTRGASWPKRELFEFLP